MHTVGLPEVSKLIDSVISKRQGDRRKHCEKKCSIKGKMDSLWASKISLDLMDRAIKQSTHQNVTKCFFIFQNV